MPIPIPSFEFCYSPKGHNRDMQHGAFIIRNNNNIITEGRNGKSSRIFGNDVPSVHAEMEVLHSLLRISPFCYKQTKGPR